MGITIWPYEALEQNVEWSGVDGWMEWSGYPLDCYDY